MRFKKLKITNWRQFEDVEIQFNERLTVLTGANASGKTTILNILAAHCGLGWDTTFLATPEMDKASRNWKWNDSSPSDSYDSSYNKIGEIEYSTGDKCDLSIGSNHGAEYKILFAGKEDVSGFFIPSHRAVFKYQQMLNIPREIIDKTQAFKKGYSGNKTRYFGTTNVQSISFNIKETLFSWNIFGRGNPEIEPNEVLLEYYLGFENILKKIIPHEVGFKKFVIRNFEIVLECESGDFILEAVSGGLSTIIELAWLIYCLVEKDEQFTVLIDEIENHLHPTMQRRLLSYFLDAFPHVSFIVSTHSPLIVGSVRESEAYVLTFNDKKKVVSQRLDLKNKAKTASEILDEALGVSFTMPIWAEEKLNEIVNKYVKLEITETTFYDMKAELSEVGLERLIPESIANLIKQKDDKN
ncbi:ATP-dependent OLD family endonuclease [Candidatus Magnetoovum chiemensis]|nr:ATP-dependent OLD family endonuclease [Candidatus Magnetoovum chiemensis]